MNNAKSGGMLMLLMVLLASGSFAGEGAVQLEKATDIVSAWKSDQHLYVKGDLGLGERQLTSLEQWLDKNASNWTVLLVESAQGEEYRESGGRKHRSLDAVEHAVGQGLAAKTGFGDLLHPKTGEPNGASFVLFLKERKFSYYGSEAYNRRGLGGNKWNGNLDASAIRAMRNGGRIADAAKNSIKDIDDKLRRKLSQEVKKKEEMLLREQRRGVAVGLLIGEGEEQLKLVEGLLAEFRKNEQYSGGDIAGTDSAKWQADLQSASTALSVGQINMAGTVARAASSEMSNLSEIVHDFYADREVLASLEDELVLLDAHPANQSGQKLLATLPQLLEEAKTAHAEGNQSYRDPMQQLQTGVLQVRSGNQAITERLKIKAERLEYQARMRNRTLAGVGAGAGTLLLTGGVVGNRRRRKTKTEAEALLAKRREELKDVSDQLIGLMDRAGVIVGPEADLPERGYEGETLLEAKRALAAVDEAFVISSHVHDLIEKGAALIQPGNPLSSAMNLVSRGSYQDAIELLDDEVMVQPSSPPPLPGSIDQRMPDRLGVADGEDFVLEFPEWTERLEGAMKEGAGALDIVDDAWATIVERREKLLRRISDLKNREEKITSLAEDGWLGLEILFGKWISRMEELHQNGMEMSQADPVAALLGPIATGDRMVEESGTLVDHIARFREERWVEIKSNEEKLTRQEQATVWLDQRLNALTEEAEAISADGLREAVGERVSAFGQALLAMAQRVEDSVKEAVRADKVCLPALKTVEQEVARAREELGRHLQVAAETVLTESPERNPSHLLSEGYSQRDAAQSALDVGDPEIAREFLNEVDRLVAEAKSLVSSTENAYKNYEGERRELVAARDAWERRVVKTKELVATLRSAYAPHALLVDAGIVAGNSYADAPQRFDESLRVVADLLEKAAVGHSSARLLEAQEQLVAGSESVKAGEELCSEIEARRDALAAMEKKNAGLLKDRIRVCEDLKEQLADRRVMRATLDLFAESLAELAETRSAVESVPEQNNPYRASALLESLDERLAVVQSEVANDLQVYQHAVEVLEKVRLSEKEALGLVQRAGGDGIPDSTRTKEGISIVQEGGKSIAGVVEAMKENHGDWRAVVDELSTTHTRLSEASVMLREELRLAQQAIYTIKKAEEIVRTASRWRGRFGVHIVGTPGGDSIVEANRAIMAGHYHPCMRHAGFAITQARQAIAQAEAREAAIRQARAAEAARRRAAARRSRMSQSRSTGSFGGGSSFGSSSSVGRSTFSSSSGMGRSGW